MAKDGKQILSAADIQKAIENIADEIVSENKGSDTVVVVGIMQRGYPLAKRIAAEIQGSKKVKVAVGGIDVSLYRDDLAVRGKDIKIKKSEMPFSIDGRTVILVDDVLYKGRTARAALDSLNDYGRPAKVQLAVLIDRGGRELPIQPDYLGKKVSTSTNEEVSVKVKEIDGEDAVILK